jgi:pimeloyl-ACP methyl ester carboxylesterase
MPHIKANGLDIYYETHGDPAAEPILLIMGLGAQMTRWPPSFWSRFVDAGHRVVLFDNRDVGLTEKLDAAGMPDIPAILQALAAGTTPPAAYTLADMAADTVGLLDALEIERAHVVGASMGGMIAQLVAADYPERVLTLTSVMSTTGNRSLPPAKPEAIAVLNNRGPDPREDLEGFLANAVTSARAVGSPGYPAEEAVIREQALANFQRSFAPMGFLRQYAGVMASPDRRPKLQTITAPTLVIHGADDALVPVEGGHDTAANIPGAKLKLIPGMGHDLPAALHAELAADILSHAALVRVTA